MSDKNKIKNTREEATEQLFSLDDNKQTTNDETLEPGLGKTTYNEELSLQNIFLEKENSTVDGRSTFGGEENSFNTTEKTEDSDSSFNELTDNEVTSDRSENRYQETLEADDTPDQNDQNSPRERNAFVRNDESSTNASQQNAGLASDLESQIRIPDQGIELPVEGTAPSTNAPLQFNEAINSDPTVGSVDLGSTNEDTAISFSSADLLANSSDLDGDSLSVTAVSVDPAVGSISGNATDGWTFTPTENYNGDDVPVSFTVSDGNGGEDSATATLDVAAVNDGPEAGNVELGSTNEDTAISFSSADLLANSTDVDGDSLSITAVSVDEAVGTITDLGNGTWSFAPTENYNGDNVPLSFTVSDGNGGEDTATASLDVAAVNDGPTAGNVDLGSTNEDSAIRFSSADLLANSSDLDGDSLSVTSVSVDPAVGSISGNATDGWTFTPTDNYNGDDVPVSFTVSDSNGGEDSATATLDVAAVNDGPVAGSVDLGSTNEDSAITVSSADLLANSSDLDGDSLSIIAVSVDAEYGSISGNATDGWTFTPSENYNGDDVPVSFTVSDGNGGEDSATAMLDVAAVNDGPVAGSVDLGSTNEDTSITFSQADLVANSSDVDGDDLSVSAVSVAAEFGTIADNGDETWTFTPAENYNGDDVPVSFTVSDGNGGEESATATFDVAAMNDGPVAGVDVTATVAEGDSAVTGQLTSTDVDDGSTASYAITSGSSAPDGFTLNADGSYSFDPADSAYDHLDTGESQQLTIPVTVTDEHGASDQSEIRITVNGTNDAPVASADISTQSGVVVNASDTNGAMVLDSTGQNPELLGGATSFDISLTLASDDNYNDLNALLSYNTDSQDNEVLIFNLPGGNIYMDIGGERIWSEIRASELHDGDEHTLSVSWDSATGETVFSLDGEERSVRTAAQGHVIGENGTLMLGQEQDRNGGGLNEDQIFSGEYHEVAISVDGEPKAHWNMQADENGLIEDNISGLNLTLTGDATLLSSNQTDEASAITIDVLANDTDVDGDTLTITSVESPVLVDGVEVGTAEIVEVDGTQQIRFTPDESLSEMNDGDRQDVQFTYEVSDGDLTDSATISLIVTGQNDAPTDIVVTGGSIGESVISSGTIASNYDPAGEVVATLATTDDDALDSHTYSIVDGDGNSVDHALFEIDGNEVKVKQGVVLDHETAPTHDLIIRSTDANGATYDETITINVTDFEGSFSGTAGNDTASGTSEEDHMQGGDGRDLLQGHDGDDVLEGGADNDVLIGGAGADVIDGGEGSDTIQYFQTSTEGVNINLETGEASGGDAEGDVISNVENVYGTHHDDVIVGDESNNAIYGLGGDDQITGGEGNDYIKGGEGNDVIHSGGGHNNQLQGNEGDDILVGASNYDTLIGGEGADDMDGSDGVDAVHYGYGTEGVNVNLATNTVSGGEAEGDTIKNFENVIGSQGDDVIVGDGGNNRLQGNDGDDVITGGAGNDYLIGGDGSDTAIYTGNWSDYTITENAGTYKIVDNRDDSPDGTDTVTGVENFKFADGTVTAENLINTGPTDIQTSSDSVNENVPTGTVVATLSTIDDDALDSHSYEIVDADGNPVIDSNFEIVGNEIRVKAGADLDHESADSHDIIVQTTDANGASYSETITINIADVNEGPVAQDDMGFTPQSATLVTELNFDAGAPSATVGLMTTEAEGQVGSAADFSQAKLSVDGLDLNSTSGAQTTVSMWVQANPEGGWEMLAGSKNYDLVLNDGNIGFNTAAGDLFGTDASELNDGEWHHIVATFTNGDVSQNSIHIDGVEQPMSQLINSPKNSNANIDSDNGTLHLGSWGRDDGYRFTGAMDEVKVFDGSLSDGEIETLYDIESDNNHWENAGLNATEDQTLTISPSDLLANDTDVDGDTLSITEVEATADTHGRVEINDDGDIVFTPDENYHGDASFSYTVSDGNGGEDTATVNLNISSVNDAPVIDVVNTVSMNEGGQQEITYQLSDIDSDSVEFAASADNGTVVINDNGTITFTPDENYNGDAQITLTATDSDGALTTDTINVAITAVNDAPDAVDDSTLEITGATDLSAMDLGPMVDGVGRGITVTGLYMAGSDENVLANIDDKPITSNSHNLGQYWPDSENQTGYNFVGANGWFQDNGINEIGDTFDGGIVTFSDGTVGIVDFVSNGSGSHEQAYIYYKPYENLSNAEIAAHEDNALTLSPSDLLANDSDVDGDTLTIASVQDAEHGTVEINGDGDIVFTPDENYHGDASFTYTVNDNNGGEDTATVNLNVSSVNDAPVIDVVNTVMMNEDGEQQITYAVSDIDSNSVDLAANADNGTVVINDNGTITFTPDENYHGNAQITLTATDSDGAVTSETIDVTVNAVNDGPEVGNVDLGSTNEDSAITFSSADLLANSTDVDGDSLSVTAVSVDAEYGSISGNTTDGWTFTPTENYNGDDVPVSFTVSDGNGGEESATATFDVTAVNDGPTVSGSASFAMNEDGTLTITEEQLLDSASDIDGDALSVVNLASDNGTLSDNGDGSWNFTPAENFNGEVNLSYDVSDGTATTSTSASIDVAAVNDGPVAGSVDLGNTNEDTAISFSSADLLANSTDVDGDSLSVTAVSVDAEYGSISGNATDGWTFTPTENYNGDDVPVSFTVSDGTTTDTATASLDVAAVNDGPVAGSVDLGSTNEDTAISFSSADLLANSSDLDDDSLSVTAVSVDAEYGSISGNATDGWTFTPSENYNGDDVSISFTASDGTSTDSATATLDVAAVNDGPTVSGSASFAMNEDGPLTITEGQLLDSASDIDGDALSVVNLASDNGTLSDNGDGSWSFIPAENFNGEVNLSYGVSDGTATTPASASIAVVAVNDGPVAGSVDLGNTNEDTATTFSSDDLLANSTDVDGDFLSVTAVSVDAEYGSISGNATDGWTFTPTENYNGDDVPVSFTVSDGTTTDTATASIDVTAVNDGPEAANVDLDSTNEDTAITFSQADLIANSTDVDGDSLSVTAVSVDAEYGSISGNSTDGWSFTPAENYNGDDVLVSFTVSDGTTTDTATASIDVAAVNDGPVAVDDDLSQSSAMSFDGNDRLVVEHDDSLALGNNNDDFSVSFSIRLDEDHTGSWRNIMHKGDSDGERTPAMWMKPGDNRVHFRISTDHSNNEGSDSHSELTVGEWTHISYVKEGGQLKLYIDGELDNSVNLRGDVVSNDGDLMFGDDPWYSGIDGALDNIQVHDRALTSEEVENAAEGQVISGDDLIVHYDFEGDTPLADKSGQGHDATTVGNPVAIEYDASGDTAVLSEDSVLTLSPADLLANDSDVDGDTLSISSVQDAENGNVEIDSDGNVVFTPDENYHGEASFTYTISDGNGGEDTATVTLNVDSVEDSITQVIDTNAAANEVAENVAIGTDTGVTLSATDADGDAITYSVAEGVPFTVGEDGVVVTSGEIDFESNESYTFDVTATSADGTSSTQEITINVSDINENRGPVAGDDTSSASFTPESATLTTEITFDEGTPRAAVGSITSESDGQVGNAADFSSAKLSVDNLELNGDAGAQTTVSMWIQGNSEGSWEMLTGSNIYDLALDGGNIGFNTGRGDLFGSDASELNDGEWHHIVGVFTNGDVTQNSIYIDGVSQEMSQIKGSPSSSRANIDSDDGSLHFGSWGVHDGYRFTGSMDEIKVYDGELTSDDVSNLYAIEANNERWDAESLHTNEDSSLVMSSSELLANDTDADGDTLSISSVQDAENGSVEIDSDGNVIFTPEENYNGEATFSYTISDGNGGEDTATVTLNVDSVNDTITQITDTNTTANEVAENVAIGTSTGVTLNAVDADGDAITYSVEEGVPFTVGDDGVVVTSGEIDFESNESYSFDVTATSADGTSSTQEITININDINENRGPEADDDSLVSSSGGETLVTEDFSSNVSSWGSDVSIRDGKMAIGEDESATKTFDFGSENANQTVVISFDLDGIDESSNGGWESSGHSQDYFTITSNGTQVSQDSFGDGRSDISHSYSFEVQTDANGQVALDLDFSATGNDEIALIRNFNIVSGDDWSSSLTTSEDNLLTIQPATLLANDSDPDGDTLTITNVSATADTHGTVTLNSDGDITFVAEEGYVGNASFNYTISDGKGGTDTAQATIKIVSEIDTDASQASLQISVSPNVVVHKSVETKFGEVDNYSALEKSLSDIESVDTDGNNTYQDLNSSVYTSQDNTADTIEVNRDANNNISTYGGDDIVNVDRDINRNIDLGDGDNRLDADRDVNGSVYVGDGNDEVRVERDLNRSIDLNEGDNIIEVGRNINGNVYAGSGDDTLRVGRDINRSVGTGDGDDTIFVGDDINGSVDTGAGDDHMVVTDDVNQRIDMQDGNDSLVIGDDVNSAVNMGDGNDQLHIYDDVNQQINLGAGNDSLVVDDDVHNRIYADAGDDSVIISGKVTSYITGGSGTDSIELKYYSQNDWDRNKDNIQNNIKEFENIKFSDGEVIGDPNAFSQEASGGGVSYEYTLTLDATLRDNDGSESLSLLLNGADLPNSITSINDAGGAAISANEDGDYPISANSGQSVTVTLNSDTELSSDDLDAISATVTTTESNGGDQESLTVNIENSETGVGVNLQGDSSDETFNQLDGISDANDTINGGSGDDSIFGRGGDDQLYGGQGDDYIAGGSGNDSAYGGDGNDTYAMNSLGGEDQFSGGNGGDWTDTIQLEADPDDGDNPWTITVDGEEVEYDLAAGALELQPDTSGVVEMADGSELTFDGVETIQW